MNKNEMVIDAKIIDNTIYIIKNIISESAKETAYDKAKRMILNNDKITAKKKIS